MMAFIKKMLSRFRRLVTYGIVGVINTLVDYGIFALCYEMAGIPIGISQCVGYMGGSVCGYLLNSNVTFREGKGRTKGQFWQYIGVDAVLTVLSSLVMTWAEGADWPIYLTKIAMTITMALLHYTIYKYLVFRIKKEDNEK